MDSQDLDLVVRLRRLVDAAPAVNPPALATARFRLLRTALAILLLGGVALTLYPRLSSPLLATVSVGAAHVAFEVGNDWQGSIEQHQAEARAVAAISAFDPGVQALRVTSSRQVAGVRTVADEAGDRRFDSSEAVDAWVITVTGESAKFLRAEGWALIDARTGKVLAADLLQTNE